MKKVLFFAAGLLMLATACQNEELKQDAYYEFTISATGNPAKVSMSEEGAFAWETGDAIDIWCGTNAGFHPLTTKDSGDNASFKGWVMGTPQTCAIYPAGIATSPTTVVLPDSYKWVDGKSFAPMYSEFDPSGLVFRQLGGVMRFKFEGMPAEAAKFVFSTNKRVTGSFAIAGGEIVAETAAEDEITFTFTPQDQMVFSVPVPVGEYIVGIALYDANDAELLKIDGKKTNTVVRNGVLDFGPITYVDINAGIDPADIPLNVMVPADAADYSHTIKRDYSSKPVTFGYADAAKPADKVSIDSDAARKIDEFVIDLPESHVELGGELTIGVLTASTSETTLVIGEKVTVETLIVEKGNLVNNGKVNKIIWKNVSSVADLARAFKNGGDVALGADIDINVDDNGIQLPLGKSLTLDLNGKTITAGSADKSNIRVYGTMTLCDNANGGRIVAADDYSSKTGHTLIEIIGEEAKLIMNSGEIYSVRGNGNIAEAVNKGQFAVGVDYGGDFEMNGGTITAGWYAVAGNGGNATQNSEIVINDGTLKSLADYAIYLPHKGVATIKGGKVIGGAGAVCIRAGKLYVEGGMLVCEGDGNTGESGDGTGLIKNTNMKANAAIRVDAQKGYAPIEEVIFKAGILKATKAPVIVADSDIKITGAKLMQMNNNGTAIRLIEGAKLSSDISASPISVTGGAGLKAIEVPAGETVTVSDIAIDNVQYGVYSNDNTVVNLNSVKFGEHTLYNYNSAYSARLNAYKCTFRGWLSGWRSGASFKECEFLLSKSFYPAVVCYGNTVFEKCDFWKGGINPDFYKEVPDKDGEFKGYYHCDYVVYACNPVETIEFTDCTQSGVAITTESHPYHDADCPEGWGDGKKTQAKVTVNGAEITKNCVEVYQ